MPPKAVRASSDSFYSSARSASASASSASDMSESSSSGDTTVNRTALCIRNVANFSRIKPFQMLDKKNFNPKLLDYYIDQSSPKLAALFEKIAALDASDLKREGKTFKHMIFTDNKSSSYGAKIIASAFIAKGYNPAFHVQGSGFTLYPEEKLLETKGHNFSLLMSKSVFDRAINVKFKKSVLEMYNRRPENVQGELTRFIILDQGFKEGIDLFDVKYVHLFEPLVVPADQKQAIGRGTRFCGQRGLEFHPRYGWPLYVFRYEVNITPEQRKDLQGAQNMFNLYLKYANIDIRKVVFAAELEEASVNASVDKELTKTVHQFTIERPPAALRASTSASGGVVLRSNVPHPPKKLFNSITAMNTHLSKGFKQFAYPKVKLENMCKDMAGGAAPQLVQFTPTQDFIRHYFQPESAYKGMLLWHSVGTGKTCSAIATASTSFEKEGYTILWVTRHTLKSDIWKNMFQWVCSMTVQERLKNGTLKLPANLTNPKRFAPPEWMEPISYKQFSNMLLKKNKIYDEIVKRNGAKDPLRKTLVIIDEAHKLYSPTVVGSEKPRTDILEEMIQNSYKTSGKDSVRVLLMTATPYTEDGMEMVKLLNILRERDPLPNTFEAFGKKYLDDQGKFKPKMLKDFQDDISGYISYLNRSQDARNFAHPVLEDVFVDLTQEEEVPEVPKEFDEEGNEIKVKKKAVKGKYEKWMAEVREQLKEQKVFVKEAKKEYKDCAKGEKVGDLKAKIKMRIKQELDALKDAEAEAIEKCKDKPTKERKECRDTIKASYKAKVQAVKEKKAQLYEECKQPPEDCEEIGEELDKLENDLVVINEEKLQVRAYMDEIKERMKKLSTESKELRKIYKEDKAAVKSMIVKNKQTLKGFRAIKDKKVRLEKVKAYRAAEQKEIKDFIIRVKDMRSRLAGIKEERQLTRLELGKTQLKKVSQMYALEKRCKL